MNWPLLIITLISTAAIAIGAFAIGWEISVRRHRAHMTRLRNRYLSLQVQLAEITDEVATDPVQFGIQTGRDYVINRVEQLVVTLRDEDA